MFVSFQVGDLVLIILDERHDNYVLFTVGPTLYFLHSESLTALDLKPGEAPPDLLPPRGREASGVEFPQLSHKCLFVVESSCFVVQRRERRGGRGSSER